MDSSGARESEGSTGGVTHKTNYGYRSCRLTAARFVEPINLVFVSESARQCAVEGEEPPHCIPPRSKHGQENSCERRVVCRCVEIHYQRTCLLHLYSHILSSPRRRRATKARAFRRPIRRRRRCRRRSPLDPKTWVYNTRTGIVDNRGWVGTKNTRAGGAAAGEQEGKAETTKASRAETQENGRLKSAARWLTLQASFSG